MKKSKAIIYNETADSLEEAKTKARELLLQLLPADEDTYTIKEREATAKDGSALFHTFSLVDGEETEAEARLWETDFLNYKAPTVCIWGEDGAKDGKGRSFYKLYLYYDRERLPFYAKYLHEPRLTLPVTAPLLKPELELKPEDVHTPEGRRILDSYFDYGRGWELRNEDRAIQLIREAPEELRIYGFFENYYEDSLQDIERDLKEDVDSRGGLDGEYILAVLTGKTHETEAEYRDALRELYGSGLVNKYQGELKASYKFYSTYYFVKYMEYLLRQKEDYSLLKEQEPELAKRCKYQESEIRKRYGVELAIDIALSFYLGSYFGLEFAYEGLSSSRIADYMRIPFSVMRYQALNSTKIPLL